jgi:hypothetical protein
MGEYEVGFIDDLLYVQTVVDFCFVVVDATPLSTDSIICGPPLPSQASRRTIVDSNAFGWPWSLLE